MCVCVCVCVCFPVRVSIFCVGVYNIRIHSCADDNELELVEHSAHKSRTRHAICVVLTLNSLVMLSMRLQQLARPVVE